MEDKIYNLAKDIISIKTKKDEFVPKLITFEEEKRMTCEFYKKFFNNKKNNEIDLLDSKISYRKNKNLKDFNGRVFYGTLNNIIELPLENNIKTATGMVHEKAHTYQDFVYKNEIIPSFFELLFSYYYDKEYNGLFKSNVNYKINEAKKVAENYVYYFKNKKYDLKYHQNFLLEFYLSFYLFNIYLKKDETLITKTLESILFENEKLDSLKNIIYQDSDFKNNCYSISLWNVFLLPKYPCFIN